MLGLQRAQVMREIILPQAVPIVLPPMGNYLVSLLKDTSIASLIRARTDASLTRPGRDILSADGVLFAGGGDVSGHGMADDARRATAGAPFFPRSAAGRQNMKEQAVPARVDAVVIGSGALGAATAFHLVAAGLSVALLDKTELASQT